MPPAHRPRPHPAFDVVGLCGSLLSRFYRVMPLRLAGECMSSGMRLEIVAIGEIPMFDTDGRCTDKATQHFVRAGVRRFRGNDRGRRLEEVA